MRRGGGLGYASRSRVGAHACKCTDHVIASTDEHELNNKHWPSCTSQQVASSQAEVERLQGEVATLTEHKTSALLRAEYAEGMAEAAQAELIAVTKK